MSCKAFIDALHRGDKLPVTALLRNSLWEGDLGEWLKHDVRPEEKIL